MTIVSIAKGGVIRQASGKFGCHPGKAQESAFTKSTRQEMKLSWANVRDVLFHSGPMTMHEVALFFPDHPYQNVGAVISAMRRKVTNKQIYIYSWTREGVGRKYLRAIYALGNKRDANKPPVISHSERCAIWREKRKNMQFTANSVFDLAREVNTHAVSRVRGVDKSSPDIVEAGQHQG